MLAGAGALIAWFDWILDNLPEALDPYAEPFGDVASPQEDAGSSKRLTGEGVGIEAGPGGIQHSSSSVRTSEQGSL